MARNDLVYFESYQRELISLGAYCSFSTLQLSASPLGCPIRLISYNGWMNKLITNISAFIIVFLISSCNILELYERPMYRIQNYCDYVADFTIITESTDTVHYNNIQNNTSGDFVNTIEGKLYVSVSVHGKSEQYADSTIVVHNRKYTITLHDGEVFGYHNIHLAITYEKYY